MVGKTVAVRVRLLVEINVNSATWDGAVSVDEVHRQGELLAVKEIERLCQRYVKIIGQPMVEAVIARKER
jgi:hypothetical protein